MAPMSTYRLRDALAGAGAAAGLLAVLFGVPAALGATVGWPLPHTAPSVDAVVAALRYGQIAPATVLRGLAVAMWVLWALAASSIGVEVIAVVRGSIARTVPGVGALQPVAARLVATAMLLSSLTTRAAAAPLPTALPQSATVAMAASGAPPATPATPERTEPDADAVTWTVERRESLWSIAERALGDGRRWREIAERNTGRRQPDGGHLRRNDTLIRPGWTLVLPADAKVRHRRAATVVVRRGDDLWHLAERHLDDGDRWTELFAANRGRPQPDGGRLTDPDVIRPGWVIHLPGDVPASHDPDSDRDAPDGDPAARRGGRSGDAAQPPEMNHGPPERAAIHRQGTEQNESAGTGPPPPPAMPTTPRTLGPRVAPTALPSAGPRAAGVHTGRPGRADPPQRMASADRPTDPTTSPTPSDRRAWPTAGALLAAALVGMLARQRRHGTRVRTAAGGVSPVDPEAAELERWLRSMADHDLDGRLDHVLCVLTDHFAAQGVSPDVVAVEVGARVTLRLGTPHHDAPVGIAASTDGRRWTVTEQLELAATVTTQRYVPALVTCGALPSGALLLIDVLRRAAVGVVGDPEDVARVATSWTAELASTGATKGVEVVVVGGHHPLLERFARVAIARDVEGAVQRVRRALDDGADTSRVVVVHTGPVGDDFDALRRVTDDPRAGLVVIGGHGPTHLRLGGGRVRLMPGDEWLDAPRWLTPDDWDRFGDLLRTATGAMTSPPHLQGMPDVGAATDDVDLDADPSPPVVGLLGPLTVNGRAVHLDRDATELLTYLAVDRTGGGRDALAALLWPADPDAGRLPGVLQAVTDAIDLGGAPPFVHTDDGRVEPTEALTTDVGLVERVVHGTDHLPDADQVRRMRFALSHVRGEPFAAAAAWAHADGTAGRVTTLLVDMAHRLAVQALAVVDLDLARFAVDRGLRAAPLSELLHRDGMRIADAAGDHDDLDRRMNDLRALVEADGASVTRETAALYAALRGLPADTGGRRRDAS